MSTTTHAKLRASQGDVTTARRILESILAARPDDREASALLDRLGQFTSKGYSEPSDDVPAPPQSSEAADLRLRFRETLSSGQSSADGLKGRLEELLTRIEDIRRRGRAR